MLIKRFRRWIDDRIRKAVDLAMLKAADDVAANIDLAEVAERVARSLRPCDVALHVDPREVASEISVCEVAEHLDVSAEEVAAAFDVSDVAAEVDYSELAGLVQDNVSDELRDEMLQAIMEKLQAAFAK